MKKTQQKTPKGDDKAWLKWGYVGIALLIAVAMVGTYFAPVFGSSQKAQIGNNAAIGYTIRGEDGRPIITTDQNLFSSEYEKGNLVLLTRGLTMPVGGLVSGENVATLPVEYPPDFGDFGLLGFETNAISEGLVGMRPGEVKVVSFSYGENNLEMNRDDLVVAEVYANQGPTLKRYRPRAHGRAFSIRKHTSHITVVLDQAK